MNNIYKVIWSKAKNCYVVASEIAKSHTKSASGQSVRRSALASLLALSLLCGGLGVASASLEVVDQSGTAGTVTIYTKDEVDHALTAKGAATDVAKNTADIATNKNNITKLENDKLSKDVASATYATKDALNDLTTTVNGKADEAAVATALDGKANKADTLAGYGITDAYTKGDVDDKLNAKADAANVFTKDQTYTRDQVNTKLADYAKSADVYTKTDADAKFATSGALTTAKTELDQKIDKEIQDRENAIKDTNDRTGGIARNTEKTQTTIEGIVKVDNQGNVKDVKGLAAETITTSGNADLKGNVILGTNTANTVTVNGNADFNEAVNMDKGLTVTSGDTTLKGTKVDGKLAVTDDADLKNTKVDGTLITTGKATFQEAVEMDKGLTVTGDTKLKATTVDGKLTAGDADLKNTTVGGTLGVTGETTLSGELKAEKDATFEKNVTVGKDLTVDGKLNVGEIYLEHKKLEPTGKDYDSATSIKADGISNRAKVTDENGNTTESKFTHNEKGTFNYAKDKKFTGEWKGATSNVTADGVENIAKDSKGNNNTFTQTSTDTKNTLTDKEGNTSSTRQDSKGIYGYAKDKDGNKSYTKQEGNRIAESVIGQDGKETKSEMTSTDITNTAKDGTITSDAKDIVNNAQDTITNTAGTSITNQVNDSKVTTDANGTTFENNTPAVSDGGATTTKINGNQITTGRVDANELGVSDKDGTNTADLSVKAGEGVKASASDGTTTGSLDVTADEVGSTVKDASGKGSTFKQRIDAIMMESKNVSIKAEETLTNEAKVITNKASEVINNEAININNTATGIIKSKASEIQNQADRLISNKVGENTWENMEDGKITTSIKNGTKQNLTQSDAEKTEHSVVNGSNSTVNKQTSEEITDAVTNGTTTNVTQNTATSSNNTIADKNGNANTVISTADGTSFINSDAMTPVTGASGAGTAVNTTIKGNTITTGKVTMDYAEVMKDLGVHGNANITGKTTTGSLEVTGTSTLKGDVTMGSNATVNGNFTVNGTTNLKDTNVGGKLDVTGKATFSDDVDIKKNLSVVGDVMANSYKVGDKTYIDKNGIHANGQKITDVADGSISEGSKDAVNGGQLYTVKNDFEGKVNKVGANAAAMANLHPMEFDPDSKWNIAAAIGNYGSETAAALGAFYRPNDDVMVNLSTAFGTGENMVGGGVSVRLGKGGNKLSREETNALKAQVADLTARMDALLSVLNPNMSKDFPDVPENHWAYEAVSRLAGNDIVQGYPDGEFHGERTMTRYEMAEIIYNALSRGAEAEKELVEEFKPELQAMAASEKATAEKAEG